MLKERTSEVIAELKNLEDLIVKFTIDNGAFQHMDVESFEGIKCTLNLMDKYYDLMEAYATMMDDQNKKIDLILEKLNERDKA